MLGLLIRAFVPNSERVDDIAVRAAYGVLAGGLGIVLNLLLFAVKLGIGLATGSVAIVADAFNNLSDMGSSIISIVGIRMASRKPDAEHPFGHGRVEYIAALLVAVLIMVMGVELIRESIPLLSAPAREAPSTAMVIVIVLAGAVKLWMMHYNRKIGRRINAPMLIAAAQDSMNDVIATAVVLGAALLGPHVALPVDALAGMAMAVWIIWSGYKIAGQTIDSLLGGKPDRQLAQKITALVMSHSGIEGVHDMILHDYGPAHTMASVHVEVPGDMDMHAAHKMIDDIELCVRRELGISLVIHMDPVVVGDARHSLVKGQLTRIISAQDSRMSMHDFRMIYTDDQIQLVFDLMMPFGVDSQVRESALTAIQTQMAALNSRYFCVIQVDESDLNGEIF